MNIIYKTLQIEFNHCHILHSIQQQHIYVHAYTVDQTHSNIIAFSQFDPLPSNY